MKYLLGLLFVFTVKAQAVECHGNFKVHSGKKSAEVNYFELEPGVPQKFCLKLPAVDVNAPHNLRSARFIEFGTINLGNASCSGVKMKVNPPGKLPKTLKSEPGAQSPAPGMTATYKAGMWVITYELNWGCNKYRAFAQWSLIP